MLEDSPPKAAARLFPEAAKGIDRAAMHGALQAGGAVAGVMSDSLERGALAETIASR